MKKPFTIKSLELLIEAKADRKFEVGAGELMVRVHVVTEVVAMEAVDLVVTVMPGAETERTLHRTCGPIRVIELVVPLLLACPVVSSGSGNLLAVPGGVGGDSGWS